MQVCGWPQFFFFFYVHVQIGSLVELVVNAVPNTKFGLCMYRIMESSYIQNNGHVLKYFNFGFVFKMIIKHCIENYGEMLNTD